MLKNYLKVAIRNLQQQTFLTVINILGLSIGLACFSLFLLYAVNEFSYDRFNSNVAHIFRLVEWSEGGRDREPGGEAYGGTPAGPALKQDIPDVEAYARIQTGFDDMFVKVGNNITRSKLSFADPALFNMFSFKLLEGNAATALKGPQNIVLSREKALQLFGRTNVVGQRVEIKTDTVFESFTVGAVCENIPTTSSIRFDMVGSFDHLMASDMGRQSSNDWYMTIGTQTFVQLRKGSQLMNEPKRLAQFRRKYLVDEEVEFKKSGRWDGTGPLPISFRLQPLSEVHTDARIAGGIDTKNIWILISIAAGVLLIACINFTTLAIGRSAGRAKEVGVRKVMGGVRTQLIFQFLAESILLTLASAVLAFFLAQALLPYFSRLAGAELQFSFVRFPELTWLLLGVICVTGLLAGIYPALVLSGFTPVEVLKSRIRLGGSNFFTKFLITGQFVLAVALIISTLIILQQLQYMRSRNIGFDKENIVMVDAEGTDTKKTYALLKQALEQSTGIAGVSASEMGMGEGTGLMGAGLEYKGEKKGVIMYPVDVNFLDLMGMQLIAGRNFNPSLASDSVSSIIVNEAFLRGFKITIDEALGLQLKEAKGRGKAPKTIIGVIKDFNFSPLKEAVRPQMFLQPPSIDARKLYVRLSAGDPSDALAKVKDAWNKIVPGLPFRYNFLDESFDRFYKTEEKWTNVVGSAGAVSIFLACLGLFGLVALTAVNRTKEIGIRKVLGATTPVIVRLLSKDFLKLVSVAIIIATPLTWYFMNRWLLDYEYRIQISWWTFILVAAAVVVIALITISFQSIKAALMNPVKTLRSE